MLPEAISCGGYVQRQEETSAFVEDILKFGHGEMDEEAGLSVLALYSSWHE